jgi:ABC-type polysaccharide/polyol phosphate export permease
MFTINKLSCQTFWQLLVSNFHTFKPRIKDQALNGLLWSAINIGVFAYIMPTRGVSADYGSFILITIASIQGFFIPVHNVILLVSDMNDQGSNLHYELTLPTPQSSVFVKYALANAYQGFITTILMIPFGKILLWNSFSFQYFSFFKFYGLLILICLFSGFFSLFLASRIHDLFKISNMWQRIIFPLWFLAGFQFSWSNLYEISPLLAYINLLNPLTYALEGGRAAALNPALSLPYWNCVCMLLLFTGLFGYLGVVNLKKRLDCL